MIQQRRAKNVALIAEVLQTVFTAVMLVIWLWSRSQSAMACLWLLAGGLPVWLMAALIFYCRELEQRESLEFEELSAAGAEAETIFEGDGDRELRLARRRLNLVMGWGVPVFTFLWAAYHAVVGGLLLNALASAGPAPEIRAPGQGTLFVALLTFLAFLFSFYTLGMSRRPQWRVLRGPGGYLLVNVLAMVAVATSLVASWQEAPAVDGVVAWVLPLVQLVLAAELLLNVVLDFYRPRLPSGQERMSFESRISGLLADPQRVGTSIADAINYQFGFEVTGTWFYQLFSRAFLPLIVFGVAVMLLLTSVVIVDTGEVYVIQRFGRLDPNRAPMTAGLRFKLPWPIETAHRFDVGEVREVLLGSEGLQDPDVRRELNKNRAREYFIWKERHGVYKERDFLVAVPRAGQRRDAGAEPVEAGVRAEDVPAVNIIKLLVSVQYVIDDVYKFGYEYQDADKVLNDIAYRVMTNYCASATLDEPAPSAGADRPQAIMTTGRGDLARALHERIAAALEEKLGVKITFVEILAVHPPTETAEAYEKVLEAERAMVTKRYDAEAVANRVLASVAGDPLIALRLGFRLSVLSGLQRMAALRNDPRAFGEELAEQIRIVDERIDHLRKEIQLEIELGRVRAGRRTANQELVEVYKAHRAELEEIGQAAASEGGPPSLTQWIAKARKRRDELFARVEGQAALIVAEAEASRWRTQLDASAIETAFRRHMLPYQAAEEVYKLDLLMQIWERVLPNAQKTVLAVPRDRVELWMNFERSESFVRQATMNPEDVPSGK